MPENVLGHPGAHRPYFENFCWLLQKNQRLEGLWEQQQKKPGHQSYAKYHVFFFKQRVILLLQFNKLTIIVLGKPEKK